MLSVASSPSCLTVEGVMGADRVSSPRGVSSIRTAGATFISDSPQHGSHELALKKYIPSTMIANPPSYNRKLRRNRTCSTTTFSQPSVTETIHTPTGRRQATIARWIVVPYFIITVET